MRLLATGLLSLMLLLSSVAAGAQTGATSLSLDALAQDRAQRLAEQQQPRTSIPLDPKQLDKYVGIYQTAPYAFFALTRQDQHFLLRPLVAAEANQNKFPGVEFYPESPTKFFAKANMQISFNPNTHGKVTELVV